MNGEYNMKNNEVWLVGQDITGIWDFRAEKWDKHRHFEIAGIFESEELAVAACRDKNYWVAPIPYNTLLPHKSIECPGAYYPHDRAEKELKVKQMLSNLSSNDYSYSIKEAQEAKEAKANMEDYRAKVNMKDARAVDSIKSREAREAREAEEAKEAKEAEEASISSFISELNTVNEVINTLMTRNLTSTELREALESELPILGICNLDIETAKHPSNKVMCHVVFDDNGKVKVALEDFTG